MSHSNRLRLLLMLSAGLTSLTATAAPVSDASSPSETRISADFCQLWEQDGERVLLLRGQCRIEQRGSQLTGQQMVVWHSLSSGADSFDAYAEGDVRLEQTGQTRSGATMLVRLTGTSRISYDFRREHARSASTDPVFTRAVHRRDSDVEFPRNHVRQTSARKGPVIPDPPGRTSATGPVRRLRFFQRSGTPNQFETRVVPGTTPPEQIWILTGGVTLLVDNIVVNAGGSRHEVGLIDLSADRILMWTDPVDTENYQSFGETLQSPGSPLQIYLEGNIVVRQGHNLLRATHAFIDVRSDRAVLLNAELRAWIPQMEGYLRVRAERLRRLAHDRFHAQNAWTSASPFGRPGYRLQASDILLEQRYTRPRVGAVRSIDPVTGLQALEATLWITSTNNRLFINEVPTVFIPRLSFPADDPGIPLRRASTGHDRIFGAQVRTAWDMETITGITLPVGADWSLLADYFSARGPSFGTEFEYNQGISGQPGSVSGEATIRYLNDEGLDSLGRDRRSLVPATDDRYEAGWSHRQQLPLGTIVFGEIGFISDRNYLEQFDEIRFDEGKDVETLVGLKQDIEHWSWSVLGRPQVNEFETTTQWLPRADLYGLSHPLFGGALTWSSHSSAAYASLEPGAPPVGETFTPLPWVANVDGGVVMTRHELDAPLQFGPLQVVPFVMGEAAWWGSNAAGNDIHRTVLNAGVRSSIMVSRIFPGVQSRIFNLNGLAHKIVLSGEYSWMEVSENLGNILQYNEFDENSQERFRTRLVTNTFGPGPLPAIYNPRFYAVRTGAGQSVVAPYHELVADQQVLRLNLRQRLQTRVGPPGRTRIRDWMIIETGASWFPRENRDNFGEDFGLINGRWQWNVGERTSLRAGTMWDLFNNAQNLWNVGVVSQRSNRGSLYVGFRQVHAGVLDSRILTATYSYAMSPKWISTFGTAFDLAENKNRGQSLTITRVGLDWIFHLGMNYDQSKNNAGLMFSLEPRFGYVPGSPTQLSSLLGVRR